MTAPFSASDAAHVLGTLAAIAFALGAIAVIVAGLCRFAKRAILLGVTLSIMAGAIGAIFA